MKAEDKLKKLMEKEKEAQKLRLLMEKFPDLEVKIDRWKTERYSSKSVNPIATDVDYKYNCGCCHDSPLEARPYVMYDDVKIYSDPDCFWVADKSYNGPQPYPNWSADLEKAGISKEAIQKIRIYLSIRRDDDDDD